jgi:hypothetical protein
MSIETYSIPAFAGMIQPFNSYDAARAQREAQ